MLEGGFQQAPDLGDGKDVDLGPLDLDKIVPAHRHLFEIAKIMPVAEKRPQRQQNVVAGRIRQASQRESHVVAGDVASEVFLEWHHPIAGPADITLIGWALVFLSLAEELKKLGNSYARAPGLG